VFSPDIDWHNVDWSSAPAIQEMNVQSVICEPQNGATIELHGEGIIVRLIALLVV